MNQDPILDNLNSEPENGIKPLKQDISALEFILAISPIPVIGELMAYKLAKRDESKEEIMGMVVTVRAGIYMLYFQLSCVAYGIINSYCK